MYVRAAETGKGNINVQPCAYINMKISPGVFSDESASVTIFGCADITAVLTQSNDPKFDYDL